MIGKGKKTQKKGGRASKRPPLWPEPVSASSEGDEDLGEVRAFMTRLGVKQKACALRKAAKRAGAPLVDSQALQGGWQDRVEGPI